MGSGQMDKLINTKWAAAIILGSAAFVLAGCGGSDSDGGVEAQTATVVETADVAPVQPETVTAVETEQEPEQPAASGSIEVPNVVGLDHQLAQDTMQAAGLYSLAEEDATGEGRLLLFDRNWTVVSQDPPAGTTVSEDRTIILHSKKDDE